MAQPSLKAFAELLHDDEVFVVSPEWAKHVFSVEPNIRAVPIPSDELHGLRGIAAQVKRLKEHKFDSGIILPPSFSSAAVFTMLGVERRFGFPTDGRRLMINFPVEKPVTPKLHRMHQYQLIFEFAAGWKVKAEPARIEAAEDALVTASELLERNGIEEKTPYAAIAPQAVAESRRWGSGNYGALAKRLADEKGLAVILLGTKAEWAAGEKVRNSDGRIFNFCGKTDIPTASVILSKAKVFVGNDSGLAHLAAASGAPLVVLSGADDPEETSPMTPYKTVIIRNELECISCVRNKCPLSGDAFMRCMTDISVDEVFKAATFFVEG